jgi:hypothetical protein
VAVGRRQRLYSGVRMFAFTWFYLSSIKTLSGWQKKKRVDLKSKTLALGLQLPQPTPINNTVVLYGILYHLL